MNQRALSMKSLWARLLCIFVFASLAVAHLRAQVVSSSFKNSTEAGWTFTGTGYTPTLTSGAGDPTGNGWLRLTNTAGNLATSAYYDTAFNSQNASIYATFDFQSYGGSGGSTIGGDGIVFFLYDGAVPFSVGAYGGSMGYAQKTGIDGLAGGYLGVALDEYGNFSAGTEGRVGGAASEVTESISVRGPGAGTSGYAYLGGSGTLGQNLDSVTRPSQTNTVQLLLSATNQLTVTLQQGGVSPQTILQMDLSGYARPETLNFGFSSGSGAATNNHLVRNLNVTALASNLWSNMEGNGYWDAAGVGTNVNNWNPSVNPTIGADVLFDNTYVASTQTISVNAAQTVRSLSFDAPFNYSLSGSAITFDNRGVPGFSGIAVSQTHGAGTHSIADNLILANAINIRNNSTGTLNLSGTLTNAGHNVVLGGTGVSTNLSGAISGTGAILKEDSGTATLSGSSSYSGGTTVGGGTLNANSNNALGTGGVILSGGTLGSTNGSTVNNAISLISSSGLSGVTTSGILTQSGSNALTMGGNAVQSGAVRLSDTATGRVLTVQVSGGEAATISGVISNGVGASAGGLTKDGIGSLTLSGANTYTGTTTINNGSIILGASNVLADTSSLSIASSGTLNLNNHSEKVGALTAASGASIDFGASRGVANDFVFGAYTPPASGVMVVNNYESGLDKLGTTVSGVSTANLNTIYVSGIGVVTSEAVSTSSIAGGSAYLLTATPTAGVVWSGASNGNWSTGSNWVGGSRPGTSQVAIYNAVGSGRLTSDFANNRTTAGIRFEDNAPGYTINGTRTWTLAGAVPSIQQKSASNQTIGAALNLSNSTVMDILGAGDLVISGSITSGATTNLLKDGIGAGKLILSGNNSSMDGKVYINTGTIQAKHTNALGTSSTNISNGGSLELSGGISPTNAVFVTGGGVGGTGAIRSVSGSNTMSGVITETGGTTTFSAASGATLNLTNTASGITGSGTVTTLEGPGTINVNRITTGDGAVNITSGTVNFNGTTNANSYTGVTTVSGGTLNLAKTAGTTAIAGNLAITGGTVSLTNSNQIADTATINMSGSGALNINGKSESVSSITSSSSSNSLALGTGGSLSLNSASNSISAFAGSISGTATSSLNMTGTGSLYLSGNNASFAGTVNVSNGSVNVSGSNNVLGTSTVNVTGQGNLQVQGGVTLSNSINIAGSGTSNNGALENIAGNNTLTGNIVATSASRIQSDAGTLTLTGNVTSVNRAVTVGGSGDIVATGVIGLGTAGVIKVGSGDMRITGANTFTGALTINGGSATLGANNTLANSVAVTVGTGASFNLDGITDTIGSINGSGTVAFGNSVLTTTTNGSFGGDFTGPGTLNIASGTMGLTSSISNTGLDIGLGGGTLALSGSSYDFGELNITGNSIIDFSGVKDVSLTLQGLNIAAGKTLTIVNWTDAADYFFAQGWTGATQDTRGAAPMNQIVFTGYSGNSTAWQSYDSQITPVPEPATYGAIMMMGALATVCFVRRRRTRV